LTAVARQMGRCMGSEELTCERLVDNTKLNGRLNQLDQMRLL
jgi:hypothetical protein